MYCSLHPLGICFLDVTRINSGVGSTSSISLSSFVEYSFQSAFIILKRFLNVEGCATIKSFTCTQWCVCGIGSMTDFSHMSTMLEDANMWSGLYHFFPFCTVE